MATLGLQGLSNLLPNPSGILTTINNIRANALGAGLQPSSAAQLQQQADNASYAGSQNFAAQAGGIWRPPSWKNATKWSVTVPVTSQQTSTDQQVSAATGGISLSPIIYVFDAVLRSDHEEAIRMTELPVQTGGNISDNAYLLQSRVTLEIGMSDAMDSYYAGQWSGASSKSVNAYNILASLKDSRQFVTLSTRVKIYQNMLIEKINMADSAATAYSLKANVTFRQVFVASVSIQQLTPGSGTVNANSSRPEATNQAQNGTQQTQIPAAVSQHQVITTTSTLNNVQVFNNSGSMLTSVPFVPGAGDITSTNVNAITFSVGGVPLP